MLIAANPLQPLIDVCRAILEFWHGAIGNFEGSWGVAIILLTFTVRIAILPLTFKGVKSMHRLQQLQPEMKRIQERYKDDRQRMNQEMMAFYRREKANPASACLPLVLQLPFFLSLFYLLRSNDFQSDIAGNESFLFISDLAEKVTGGVLAVLIVLYIGTQLAASAVTAMSADKTQQRIMFALPFVFAPIIVNFQAGLIVYWITTNVWTVGQQLLVRKLYPKPEPVTPSDEREAPRPARRKPVGEPAAADGKPAAAKQAPKSGADGRRTKPPPPPRKKKKRSGRRR